MVDTKLRYRGIIHFQENNPQDPHFDISDTSVYGFSLHGAPQPLEAICLLLLVILKCKQCSYGWI